MMLMLLLAVAQQKQIFEHLFICAKELGCKNGALTKLKVADNLKS